MTHLRQRERIGDADRARRLAVRDDLPTSRSIDPSAEGVVACGAAAAAVAPSRNARQSVRADTRRLVMMRFSDRRPASTCCSHARTTLAVR